MIYDLIIVGLGAAGMNAALYAKRSGMNLLVFEGEIPGGLLNKTNKIENFPGYVSISGPDLVSNLFIQFNKLRRCNPILSRKCTVKPCIVVEAAVLCCGCASYSA